MAADDQPAGAAVVQPDVIDMGGLSRTLEVVAMADWAVPVTPYELLAGHRVHDAPWVRSPTPGPYLELPIEGVDDYPWQQGLFVGDPFAVTDGHVEIPDGPGWGVEISATWLERADRAVSRVP